MIDSKNGETKKAAVPAPHDQSYDVAIADNSPAEVIRTLASDYPSASADGQLPLSNNRFLKTEPKEQCLQNNLVKSVEDATLTDHLSMDERQQGNPYQQKVAEQDVHYSVIAAPMTREIQMEHTSTQSDVDSRVKERRLAKLRERAKADLRVKQEQLNYLQIQYEINLAAKDQQIHSLQEQVQTTLSAKDREMKDLTNRFQAESIQKDREVDYFCQLWKQTAKELRKSQAQDKVVGQVTDPELIQKAWQIQYNVRNFAIQYFGGERNLDTSVLSSWQDLQKHIQTPAGFFEACVDSPVKRPLLIVAFLWEFLVEEIFGKFWWGGTSVHHGMEYLTKTLSKPLESATLADWSEAKKSYQSWKAKTSALLADILRSDQEREQHISTELRDHVEDLCTQLAPLTRAKVEEFSVHVSNIITEALELDELFCKQVAEIQWVTGKNGPRAFDEASMELQQGEKRMSGGQEVQLVVAPGLIKRGRSTGEDYEVTNILLKTTVSCELMIADKSGDSHQPPLPPRDSSNSGTKIKHAPQ